MCLHQLENHEPVEFGELGIDPVERDQVKSLMPVHLIPKMFQALTFVKRKFSPKQWDSLNTGGPQVLFHPDDSARLIHSGSNGFKVKKPVMISLNPSIYVS